MVPRKITRLLQDKDSSQAEIARKLKVTDSAVSQVVHGKRGTPRIRRAIEIACNKVIWK